jgi:hypothetical protein
MVSVTTTRIWPTFRFGRIPAEAEAGQHPDWSKALESRSMSVDLPEGVSLTPLQTVFRNTSRCNIPGILLPNGWHSVQHLRTPSSLDIDDKQAIDVNSPAQLCASLTQPGITV